MPGEDERLAAYAGPALPCVEHQRTATQLGAGEPAGTTDQGAQTSEQFFEVERLGQIIIGPGVDPGHFFVPVVARGEDQHRHRTASRTPGLEHAQPVHLRQTEVEHHGIIGRIEISAQMQGIDTVRGLVDGIAGAAEGFAQLHGQRRLVFNDQDTHLHPFHGSSRGANRGRGGRSAIRLRHRPRP